MAKSRIVIDDTFAGDPPKFIKGTVHSGASTARFEIDVDVRGRESKPAAEVYRKPLQRLGMAIAEAAKVGAISVRSIREK